MKSILYSLFWVTSINLSMAGGFKTHIDSIQIIKGTWVLTADSVDTSIGNNTNAESYNGMNALFDTLRFKKKKYYFNNSLSKDAFQYEEKGIYYIRNDSLITISKDSQHFYPYKINKLSETELIIEETMYTDSLGVFRLIGYYKKK